MSDSCTSFVFVKPLFSNIAPCKLFNFKCKYLLFISKCIFTFPWEPKSPKGFIEHIPSTYSYQWLELCISNWEYMAFYIRTTYQGKKDAFNYQKIVSSLHSNQWWNLNILLHLCIHHQTKQHRKYSMHFCTWALFFIAQTKCIIVRNDMSICSGNTINFRLLKGLFHHEMVKLCPLLALSEIGTLSSHWWIPLTDFQ